MTYYLDIQTWRGLCPGAIHWYGTIWDGRDYHYLRDGWNDKFFSRTAVILQARQWVRRRRGRLVVRK